jgi:hypothetical protein
MEMAGCWDENRLCCDIVDGKAIALIASYNRPSVLKCSTRRVKVVQIPPAAAPKL